MTTPPSPATAPAGWYPDPGGTPNQRYWTGNSWTDQLAPVAPSAPSGSDARAGDWIGGVLLALLMPLIGLIAGIVYATKGGEKRQVGFVTIALSCVAFFAWFVIMSQPTGGSSYGTY
jgi:hypothetical protein